MHTVSKTFLYLFMPLALGVSCECKNMHFRRLPEEKDVVFEGEIKVPRSPELYMPNESRDIQLDLASNDEKAKDAKFKIVSWSVAEGKQGRLDTSSISLGSNTLHYTPEEPGTHEITLKVAVEGEEDSAQTFHYTLEAPASEWKLVGNVDENSNLTLTINDVPTEWYNKSWHIHNTRWSLGLSGSISSSSTQLHHGANNLNLILKKVALEDPPRVQIEVQGPDKVLREVNLDLTEACIAQQDEAKSLLHLATEQSNIPLMQHLISKVADVNIRDGAGKTPLEYATEANNQEARALLLGAGAIQDLPADWQFQGNYEATSDQLILTIGDTPGRLQQARDPQAQWRITNMIWSQGIKGSNICGTVLRHGENRIICTVSMDTLTEAPCVEICIQGPDRDLQRITIDLKKICLKLCDNQSRALEEKVENIDKHVLEAEDMCQLPRSLVTNTVVREKKKRK